MRLSKTLILIMAMFFLPPSFSYACDWPFPKGTTSEWVEDKIIFWGRPIETKWDKSGKNDIPEFNIYTTIEVVEQVKGRVPRRVRVYHAQNGAACGTNFSLGAIGLIVIPEKSQGTFRTGSYISDVASEVVLSAYFTDGIDLPLLELSRFQNSIYKLDDPCENDETEVKKVPDFCKWESVFLRAEKSYLNKIEQFIEKHD